LKGNRFKKWALAGSAVLITFSPGLNLLQNERAFAEGGFSSIYEAEDGALADAIVDSQHPGYTGIGFVDYKPNAPGGTITWNVSNVPADGEYTLEFRFANGGGDNRPAEITVNGSVVASELEFPSTGEWSSWKTTSVKANLKAGENVIVATGKGLSGGANIDHLRVHNLEEVPEEHGPKPVEVKGVELEELVGGLTLKKLKEAGIVAGGERAQEDQITKAELFAMINRSMGYYQQELYKNISSESAIWEVPGDNWWSYVMAAAKQEGYATADGDGNIHPDSLVTRRQAAEWIAGLLDLSPGKSKNKNSDAAVGAVVSHGYMQGEPGFEEENYLTIGEAEKILDKIADEQDNAALSAHVVSAQAVSSNLVAVIINGEFNDFDVQALTLKAAEGSFKSLNPTLKNMYPTRAAVTKNKFGDTVVLYEVQNALNQGKLAPETEKEFTGNLEEMKKQADHLVSWQMDHGGWTKSMESEYSRAWDGKEPRSKQLGPNGVETGTIDNSATITQIRQIAEVYKQTKDEKLKESVLKGIDFLLNMQYETGGWPQVYPERTLNPSSSVFYSNFVTFNDNAMINVLDLFDDILNTSYPFDDSLINEEYRQKMEASIDLGIDYILKSQIKVDGKLTAWCAQHDPVTYEPQHARAYEHPSISGSESVGIVRYLMSRPEQTPEIQAAVRGALSWFDEVKLEGIRYVSRDPNAVYFVEDPGSVTWYRFYEIGTNTPIFSGRDGVIKHTIQEIEEERRNGYSWGGSYAKNLLETAKVTGYYENSVFVEVQQNELTDVNGRKLAEGELRKVEDATEELAAIESKLTVAQDGSGDYGTVQQAIDAVPANNSEPVKIFIKNGVYKEVVRVPADKPFITMIGESAEKTILTYDNYAKKPRPEGGTYGTSGSASVYLYASDFVAKDLTIENTFDESQVTGGSQAVAAYTRGERMEFYNVRFIGNQDTLYANGGSQYFKNSYIEGDVDFIFGAARAVFDDCDIVSVDRGSSTNNGYITAASTQISEPYGFLFINSRLKSEAADGTVYLGRPWHPGGDPNAIASVVFMNSELGSHIKAEGWTDMSGFSAKDARFYEYQNSGQGANPERPQLTHEEAASYTIENVLKGWNPAE
jgi:PelA/Pel-15E family pectate lyase